MQDLQKAQAELDDKQAELDVVQAEYERAMTEKQVAKNATWEGRLYIPLALVNSHSCAIFIWSVGCLKEFTEFYA